MTYSPPFDLWFADAAFDGSFGFTLDTLREVPPIAPPRGFEARWRDWRERARAVDAAPVVLSSTTVDDRELSLIELSGVDGVRLRAWFVATSDGAAARVGVVHGHGYGGRDAVDLRRVPAYAAAVFPVARGLGALNIDVGAPQDREAHVLQGLAQPDEYVIGLCARDLWLAAAALIALAGDMPLYYVGESLGGGLGALAVPWDERFVGATLIVPTFGQYDARLAVPCLGSGEFQRAWVLRHPEAREQLRLFDASTSALFFRIPVRVEAALWDQNVPPQGQFAVANAVPKVERAILPAGHAEYPGVESVTSDAVVGGLAHLQRALEAVSA